MKRGLVVALLATAGTVFSVMPASAASRNSPPPVTNWNQHDTAVYVVSTLNLLHTKGGKSVVSMLSNRFDVEHYNVYADQNVPNMYFIELVRTDTTVADVFAYQMGWPKPRGMSKKSANWGSHRASSRITQEYKSDPKQLIGSFDSTLPS